MQAMDTRVEKVELEFWGEVILDISALTQYSGQGTCRMVECYSNSADKYKEEVKSWARRINWRAAGDDTYEIKIERK